MIRLDSFNQAAQQLQGTANDQTTVLVVRPGEDGKLGVHTVAASSVSAPETVRATREQLTEALKSRFGVASEQSLPESVRLALGTIGTTGVLTVAAMDGLMKSVSSAEHGLEGTVAEFFAQADKLSDSVQTRLVTMAEAGRNMGEFERKLNEELSGLVDAGLDELTRLQGSKTTPEQIRERQAQLLKGLADHIDKAFASLGQAGAETKKTAVTSSFVNKPLAGRTVKTSVQQTSSRVQVEAFVSKNIGVLRGLNPKEYPGVVDNVVDDMRKELQSYFRGNSASNGHCDFKKLEDASLNKNGVPPGLGDRLKLAMTSEENLSSVSKDQIVGLLRFMPDELLAHYARPDSDISQLRGILKGVAADSGLLVDAQYENRGVYQGPKSNLVFSKNNPDMRQSAGNETIPEIFKGKIKSVQDNPGAGHCFFYSALNCMKDFGAIPNSEGQAKELRNKLIDHAATCTRNARLDSPGLRRNDAGWIVPTSRGPVNISQAEEQIRTHFAGDLQADLTNGAFLADLLKRPVVILSTQIPSDSHAYVFDCELTEGKKLTGEPVYILHTPGHFRTFVPTEEMKRSLLGGQQ